MMASLEGSRTVSLCVLVFGLTVGCSNVGSPDTAGDRSCSPLAPGAPATIGLAALLGVGQHADGTIYVLDQIPTGYRAFSSEGAKLKRREIAGSGAGQLNAGDWYVVTVTDPAAPFTLKVDDTSGTLQMGVVRGAFSGRDFTIGEDGDVLEIRGTDALAGLVIQDLPDVPYVEYWAHLPDGRTLLVIRPNHDWSYDDFRLFLGTTDQMIERPVISVERARDGGTTTITFTLDGARATAYFPAFVSDAEAARLTVNHSTVLLTTETAGTAPDGAAFLCF